MRLAESLTLPQDLEIARSAGELVIFAGAGVSMGAPALLPNFEGLAREIAEPKMGWRHEDADALDIYLGDAERAGVDVQVRAREKLQGRGGAHTPLHENLLRVFGEADRVRVITTNFDDHFTEAAAIVFPGNSLPRYVGPALPLGQNFRGIVQLHGSLGHTHDPLVLTDRDFADAYMTEAWAARFLVRVFAQRTVLFVGYSLTDPVMRYLMRALPGAQKWFALCPENEAERWIAHQVSPISFHESLNAGPFGDLNDGLQRWGWYGRASLLDHDVELRRVVLQGPPLTPVDEDYLRARLTTDAGRQTFWLTATEVHWFDWVLHEGLLAGLVRVDNLSPAVASWGRWALTNFCGGQLPPLLGFLRRQSLSLNPQFALETALHLFRLPELPIGPVLRQLTVLLVNQVGSISHGTDLYVYLIGRLVKERCAEEAGALLGSLTRVRLVPLEHIQLAFEDSACELDHCSPSSKCRLPCPAISRRLARTSFRLAAMLPSVPRNSLA